MTGNFGAWHQAADVILDALSRAGRKQRKVLGQTFGYHEQAITFGRLVTH